MISVRQGVTDNYRNGFFSVFGDGYDFIDKITGTASEIFEIYDKERFCSSIQKMVSEVCRNQKFEKSVVKIDAGEIKQNTKLLGTINSGDMKEYYKNLELHMAECDVYGQNEKIEILRSLGKMPRSKRSV